MTDTRREGRFTMPDRDRRKPPDRRKGDVEVLDKKLDERFGELRDRLSRFIIKATAGFAVLGVACAVGLFGFGLVLSRQHDTTQDIQHQRKTTIYTQCKQQNDRNKHTKDALIAGAAVDIAKRKTEAAKAEVRRRRDVTLGLIDALAPHQNCEALIAKSVKGGS